MSRRKNLKAIFKDFSNFWREYLNFSLSQKPTLLKDRLSEMYIVRGFFYTFWTTTIADDEEGFVPSFCTFISACVTEILQKENISNAIYNKFLLNSPNIWRSKTITRKDVSISPRTDIEEPQPLLAIENLLDKAYGAFNHSDWLRRITRKGATNSQEGIKVRKIKRDSEGKPIFETITETVNGQQITRKVPIYETTADGKPVYELQGNYQETDNKEAVAKLLRTFEIFQIDLNSYYQKARYFFSPFSFPPKGDYVYDYQTGRERWVPYWTEEEEEEEFIELGQKKKTSSDDLTEEEYNDLAPNEREETYKLERLKRFRLRLLKSARESSGQTKKQELDKLKASERLIEIVKAGKPPKVTKQEFLDYVYNKEKVIGFDNLINEIASDLELTHYLESIGQKPRQWNYVLVGPPGVGKSMIARIIAGGLKRFFKRISLGGQSNPSILYGASPTYKGANFGLLLQAMIDKRNKNEYLVVILDEFEKVKDDALMNVIGNVLDPEFNKEFHDIMLEFDIDISNIIFILTGNKPELVPKFVQERCKKVILPLYTYAERRQIARDRVNSLIKNWKLTQLENKISDKILELCITQEWGVRNAMENVEVLIRRLANLVINNDLPSDLDDFTLDDSDKDLRKIIWKGGVLNREIILIKVKDTKKEGNITVSVLTEIPDWPGYTGRHNT